uniref:Uncharacterized protein n=1 Tax=Anguilla anguilla TaxID=7936 RepID=A0A0E9QEA3_ANGAN
MNGPVQVTRASGRVNIFTTRRAAVES